jgi:GTP-binding protein YchF
MSLSIGIVGLPNVGKSTLFQALTKKQVDCANYPFCTIDPNVGVVAVPDERVDKLAELTHSAKKIYTTIEFIDIAGLIKGASQGEGLGNKFLSNIKETDAILYILRCFPNEKITSTQNKVNPLEEKGILDAELILKDFEITERRIEALEKEAKTNNKNIIEELELLKKVKELLLEEKVLVEVGWSEKEQKILKKYQFLTLKPRLYMLNGEKKDIPEDILNTFKNNEWRHIIMDILTENEAVDFTQEERKSFGLPEESGLNILIQASYKLLNLITFLTTGTDETRAWTLKRGLTTPKAGGVIHTDFEKHFIKADVINWKSLIESGSFANAKEAGLLRTEGKEYIVKDGDVIEIKSDR